jgi:hypothetical protein
MLLEHTDMSPDLLDRGGCTPLHQVLFIKHNDTNNRSDTKNRYSNNRYNDTKMYNDTKNRYSNDTNDGSDTNNRTTILKIGTLTGVVLIKGTVWYRIKSIYVIKAGRVTNKSG